jgi:anti-sigma factor (TIGR02949 family)
MSDGECQKTQARLEEFLHNELSGNDAAIIRRHIETCPNCSYELRVGRVLTEVVQRCCTENAPEELRTQVVRQLRSTCG